MAISSLPAPVHPQSLNPRSTGALTCTRRVQWLFGLAAMVVFALLLTAPPVIRAQVLAHPGWRSSTFAAQTWWQRAVFYEVRGGSPSAAPDFKALAARIDAMQSTGIDAVIVTPPTLPSLAGASAEQAIAAQAALDAFDNFTRQATARGIRVLVALPVAHADADLTGRVRFWLTRGVAGVRLEIPAETSAEERAAIAASVCAVAASVGGQRVVLMDGDTPPAGGVAHVSSGRGAKHESTAVPLLEVARLAGLLTAGPLTAAELRPQLVHALATPGDLIDTRMNEDSGSGSGEAAPLAKVLATIALASNNAALADPPQALVLPESVPPEPGTSEEPDSVKPAPPPIPPQPPPGVYLPYVPYVPPARPQKKAAPPPPPPADPLTVWYAKLSALHHANPALRTGTKIVLDFDTQNVLAWVARPASPTPQNPPVVVLCNLSAQPVTLSIADAMKKLNLHGFFLRTLLRSNNAMGAEDLEAIKLAPYGVFIGELRR